MFALLLARSLKFANFFGGLRLTFKSLGTSVDQFLIQAYIRLTTIYSTLKRNTVRMDQRITLNSR
jgi:hypothetical protein